MRMPCGLSTVARLAEHHAATAAMAEQDVSYASVVFKANRHPPATASANKDEETVYDEVKVQNETAEQTAEQTSNANAGFLPEQKPNGRRQQCQRPACCLGILCVILLLGIIAVSLFFGLSHEGDIEELKQTKSTLLAENEDLKNLNTNLSSDIQNLRSDLSDLNKQLGDLTRNYTVLESEVANLTSQNRLLKTHRSNLTQQITNMETNWINLNVSRAQWSVEAYCPKADGGERWCSACQPGWILNRSSCYAYNNPDPPGRKTWEEARKDCRGKGSDLAVAHNKQEEEAIKFYSQGSSGSNGYWIGLRVEDGEWKWVDGSDLGEKYLLGQPAEGQCAISRERTGWRSVSCNTKQRWICKKDTLSV